ncbi:MAG: stage V sporulation protein AE [Clostridia bacterium]|nr:stage V sporulation protein AE [Clostridia bacterium]MBR2943743.1 stage V sporulation protein AE [Clostridia bacterium]
MDIFFDYLWAFIIGGILCVIAQVLIDKTKLTPARILVLYVCLGVFLTAIGLYEPLVELAGSGATTPLTGFGYAIAQGVKKAVDEKGLLGALTGGIGATAGGISAAISFGLIMSLIFSSKPKR